MFLISLIVLETSQALYYWLHYQHLCTLEYQSCDSWATALYCTHAYVISCVHAYEGECTHPCAIMQRPEQMSFSIVLHLTASGQSHNDLETHIYS